MDNGYEKQIGTRIKKLREARGMTQEVLAARCQTQGCDLTRSAIAKIEVGQRHIYPDEIRLFAKILKATYEELFE